MIELFGFDKNSYLDVWFFFVIVATSSEFIVCRGVPNLLSNLAKTNFVGGGDGRKMCY